MKLGNWLYTHLGIFYYMVEKEPRLASLFTDITRFDVSFERIYRRMLSLGAKNYIRRMLGF